MTAIPSDVLATTTLRLLATSDVHMHLTGWDARSDTTCETYGFDRIAHIIDRARADAAGPVVVLDNGDSLQGTPDGDTAQEMDAPHVWASLLDAVRFDAVGLGNHDFDYGLEALAAFCSATSVPVLSASPDRPLAGVQPYVILTHIVAGADGTARPLRVGITSVLPPQTQLWNHAHLAGRLGFVQGVEAATHAVTALRQEGADVVVVLCHSGLPESTAFEDENFASAIARTVPGIDAMVLGHTHEVFPDPNMTYPDGIDGANASLFGVPAAMPGYAAALLAQIDLHLACTAMGWDVTGHAVHMHKAADAPVCDDVTQLVAPCTAASRARMQTVVGRTEHKFHSYFAMLQSGTADALMAQAMQAAVTSCVTGTPLADLPLLAATSPAAAGGRGGPHNFVHVAQGDILARHLAMISPYQNTIWAHEMTGADLYAYLEWSAHFFGADPNKTGPLVAPNAPAFNFDTVHGVHMTLDPFAPIGARVTALARDGVPVAREDRFLVAMTSYRGAGGGRFPGTGQGAALQTEIPMIDALRSRLGNAAIGPEPAPSVWSFAANAPQRVTLETSPQAAEHLDEIAQFAPEPLGVDDDGFLQLRVTL